MSHGPQLLTPPEHWPNLPTRIKGPFHPKPGIEVELTLETMRAYSERCKVAIDALRSKLATWAPDTVMIVGDDQHENFPDDAMPPFTLFIGEEVDATRKFRYFGESELDQMIRYPVNAKLAEHLLLGLMEEGFDPDESPQNTYKNQLIIKKRGNFHDV